MDGKSYCEYVSKTAPRTSELKTLLAAFAIGGLICMIGEGFGIYDKIGGVAGAGSIVPITGFANSIASPAMEFRREGIIFGLMAKMFVIAGPVIVTGIVSSVIVGVIYRIIAIV